MAIQTVIKFSAETPHHAANLILLAAKQGDVLAQATLGQILLDGYGILQDSVLAFKWFHIAAQNDCLQAYNMLGRCYENGWGCKVDYSLAVHYYQLAAEKGLTWGLYNFANLLAKGRGVSKDLSSAFCLYLEAAQKGHAKSMNLVGRFYEEGWLTEIDLDKATDWYRRSASAGDFRGQCSYASVLTRQGCIDEAVLWLKYAMQTATHGFLQKMARALWVSPYQPLKKLAVEMFELCAKNGNQDDQQIFLSVLQPQTRSNIDVIADS